MTLYYTVSTPCMQWYHGTVHMVLACVLYLVRYALYLMVVCVCTTWSTSVYTVLEGGNTVLYVRCSIVCMILYSAHAVCSVQMTCHMVSIMGTPDMYSSEHMG